MKFHPADNMIELDTYCQALDAIRSELINHTDDDEQLEYGLDVMMDALDRIVSELRGEHEAHETGVCDCPDCYRKVNG